MNRQPGRKKINSPGGSPHIAPLGALNKKNDLGLRYSSRKERYKQSLVEKKITRVILILKLSCYCAHTNRSTFDKLISNEDYFFDIHSVNKPGNKLYIAEQLCSSKRLFNLQ